VVALWAPDQAEAARFFQEVVGLTLASHHAGKPHFDIGGAHLTILRGRPLPAENAVPDRFPLLAFRVPDIEAAVARLHSAHVETPWGLEGPMGSRYVMFKDPAGNLLEFVEARH
jgi:catechol 2,3-dioxygenase-like lactoylglutathione lyase family enzyme